MGHLWNFHPWKYSNPDWIRSWVTSSGVGGDTVWGHWRHPMASRGPSIIHYLWFLTFLLMTCGNTWIADRGLMPRKPSKLMKVKQRLMRGNFRCVADNEGRKQRAVKNQWNSSCEFLNMNLLYLQQKVLQNLISGLCYTKTLYKACHYCLCHYCLWIILLTQKLMQNDKFLLLCSVLRTKPYSEKQQNNKYPRYCSVSASSHVWHWLLKKTFSELGANFACLEKAGHYYLFHTSSTLILCFLLRITLSQC